MIEKGSCMGGGGVHRIHIFYIEGREYRVLYSTTNPHRVPVFWGGKNEFDNLESAICAGLMKKEGEEGDGKSVERENRAFVCKS